MHPPNTARVPAGRLVVSAVLLLHGLGGQATACPSRVILLEDGSLTVRRDLATCASGGGGTALTNGSFTEGLDGWTVSEFGGDLTPGDVVADQEQAFLLEGDSFLVTLEQSFTVSDDPAALSFSLELDPGFDLDAAFLPDAFEVSLLDPAMRPVVGTWSEEATSVFNLQEDGTARLGPGVSWDNRFVTIDISSLPAGTPVTLYFDLIGGDQDTAGGLHLDDVSLETGPLEGFVRGDVDGSRTVGESDVDALIEWLWSRGTPARDCTAVVDFDAGDANDNEWITIADVLRLRDAISGGEPLPAPAGVCAEDPDDDPRGFDRVDREFRVVSGEPIVEPKTGSENRTVQIPILVDTPVPLTGMTLVLQFDDLTLDLFNPDDGDTAPFMSSLGATGYAAAGDRIVVGIWAAMDGGTILPGAPGELQEAGTVSFHLADFEVLRPFRWAPESVVNDFLYRSTLVDTSFDDHLPELPGAEFQFVRGNANNDTRVDLSDAVFVFRFLFTGGPTPACLDAADADNDGALNLTDGIFILNFLFRPPPLGRPIPPPYPACGFDQGDIDTLGCDPCSCPPFFEGDPCAG